ncbi:MAG: hypothetical protein KDD47_26975, partial [Acidobacteria bacterium]|nr:hypothetical protein [Acidobacteriota bacterium]
LAHELVHTLQQGQVQSVPSRLLVGPSADAFERQAETLAAGIPGGTSAGIPEGGAVPSVQRRIPPGGQGPGDPLPYREATELAECMRIMKDSDYCREQVLGEKPILPTAGCGWFGVNMKPFVTGVEGTIVFTPDAKRCPKCKAIRLIQVLQVSEQPGQDYVWPGKDKPRNDVKTAEDKAKGILPGYHVDHEPPNCTKGSKCSAYYRDHWSNPSDSRDGSNDGTTAEVASLWDRPRGDKDDIFRFETCARCDDDGSYLGCVDWGWSADGAGKVTQASNFEHGAPTATFLAAVAKFDKYYGN